MSLFCTSASSQYHCHQWPLFLRPQLQHPPGGSKPVTALWSPSGSCIKPCYSVASMPRTPVIPTSPLTLLQQRPHPWCCPRLQGLVPSVTLNTFSSHLLLFVQGKVDTETSPAKQHNTCLTFLDTAHCPQGCGSCQLTLDTGIQSSGYQFPLQWWMEITGYF